MAFSIFMDLFASLAPTTKKSTTCTARMWGLRPLVDGGATPLVVLFGIIDVLKIGDRALVTCAVVALYHTSGGYSVVYESCDLSLRLAPRSFQDDAPAARGRAPRSSRRARTAYGSTSASFADWRHEPKRSESRAAHTPPPGQPRRPASCGSSAAAAPARNDRVAQSARRRRRVVAASSRRRRRQSHHRSRRSRRRRRRP